MKREYDLSKALSAFLLPEALPYVVDLIDKHRIHIRISRQRATKLGDYLAPVKDNAFHRITVNENLNPYEFLLTFLHEWAHLKVVQIYGRKAAAHGIEWKKEFQLLMEPLLNEKLFPSDILSELTDYFKNPYASSGRHLGLSRCLQKYGTRSDFKKGKKSSVEKNEEKRECFVENIEKDTYFWYRNRLFLLQKKLRKNYVCVEEKSKKKYLFPPLIKVIPHF